MHPAHSQDPALGLNLSKMLVDVAAVVCGGPVGVDEMLVGVLVNDEYNGLGTWDNNAFVDTGTAESVVSLNGD